MADVVEKKYADTLGEITRAVRKKQADEEHAAADLRQQEKNRRVLEFRDAIVERALMEAKPLAEEGKSELVLDNVFHTIDQTYVFEVFNAVSNMLKDVHGFEVMHGTQRDSTAKVLTMRWVSKRW